ncbi:MAG: GlsB/YeaQ/YmgE family stress response membrane protein [bacterium]
MGIIIAIIVGGLIGWVASMIMNTDQSQGALANIIIGIVGSFLGSYIFGTWLGIGGAADAGSFSLVGLFWGIAGAVVLIAILKAFNVFGNKG